MKTTLLILGAASLLSAAGAAHANPPEVQKYLDRAQTQATARLAAHGVPLAGKITLKGRVSAGRLGPVRVAGSSGSAEVDQKAAQALKGLSIAGAPVELGGREITLILGEAPIVQAKAP